MIGVLQFRKLTYQWTGENRTDKSEHSKDLIPVSVFLLMLVVGVEACAAAVAVAVAAAVAVAVAGDWEARVFSYPIAVPRSLLILTHMNLCCTRLTQPRDTGTQDLKLKPGCLSGRKGPCSKPCQSGRRRRPRRA